MLENTINHQIFMPLTYNLLNLINVTSNLLFRHLANQLQTSVFSDQMKHSIPQKWRFKSLNS
jgi:hypothetical protein